MKKKIKFGQFLFIAILLLSCVPVLSVSFLSIFSVENNAEENFESNAQQLAETAGTIIDSKIESYLNKMKSILDYGNFENLDELRDQIRLLASDDSSVINLYYVDNATGSFIQVFDEELDRDFRESDWFIDVMADPNTKPMETPYEDTITGKMATTIYSAVVKDGTPVGVLAINIDLTELADELSVLSFGKAGDVTIIDAKDGFTIFNTDTSKIGGSEATEYSIWEEIVNKDSGTFNLKYDGINYKGVYTTSDYTGWKAIAKMPRREISESTISQLVILIIVMILALIAAIGIAVILIKGINKSINHVIEGLKRASKGEFDFEIKMDSRTEEFGVIEEHFNEMKESVAELISHVDEEAENLNINAGKSLVISEDIASSIEQVSKTITEIAQGTTESADNLESITGHMDDLSEAMNNMQEGSHVVSNMAKETNDLSGKGLEMISTVIDKTEETKKSTLTVKNVVEEVSDSISNIKVINETIKGFTEQTNLLALNAAIEAARAGEAGKGFAVVAEEIRKLAEETSVSSKQIDDIVKEIDDRSRVAVDSVESTVNIVKLQDEAVNETKDVFNNIISSIETLVEKVYEINEGLDMVHEMKDKVVGQVENLSAILEETAAGTEEVTASSEEVAASAQDFVNNFKEVSEMAQDLKENVNKFKL